MKNTWKIINGVLGRAVKKKMLPSSIQYSDARINGTAAMCNAFNKYFGNIGHTLSSSFVNSGDCMQYVIKHNLSAFLTPCTPREVINTVSKL